MNQNIIVSSGSALVILGAAVAGCQANPAAADK
jgi:hypothetical protein